MAKPLASVTLGLWTYHERFPYWPLDLWDRLGGGLRKSGVIRPKFDSRLFYSRPRLMRRGMILICSEARWSPLVCYPRLNGSLIGILPFGSEWEVD